MEKMREGDWGAVLRLMHAREQARAAPFGVSYDLPPFYREFEDVYRQLYWYYGLCNSWGWGGALPPVAMLLNRSRRRTCVAGYANPAATAVNGRVYCAISITLNICARGNTDSLTMLLLHEMTHIWQFASGQRVRCGSVADRVAREAELCCPALTARLRECMMSPHKSSRDMDYAFFRLTRE